jgi:hypothetical protein
MPFDLLEPALNSVYLFLGITGFLGSFMSWLYHLQKEKRKEEKKELFQYVDSKFETLSDQMTNNDNAVTTKLNHSIELLNQLLNYETRNLKLHIKNMQHTDSRLEDDIARIEGVVFFKRDDNIHEFFKSKRDRNNNKSSGQSKDMEDENNGS